MRDTVISIEFYSFASVAWGERNGPGHMTKMAAMPIYGKNLKKIFSGTKTPTTLKLDMQHVVQCCHKKMLLSRFKGAYQKLHKHDLWPLHSVSCLMMLDICVKFHKNILNSFNVIERTGSGHRNCYLQGSKGRNSKDTYTRVMVVELCMLSY